MNFLRDLEPFDDQGRLRVVVETPRGSDVKLKYSPADGGFVWSRGLPKGAIFPADFGFVPQTCAGDGDAVDALVIGASARFPGIVVPSRLVGALRVFQTRDGGPEKDNHRLLVVPANEHRLADIARPADLGARRLAELEAFFAASLALTDKVVRFDGWAEPDEAHVLVEGARQRWAA